MIPSILLALREGLEAALIIGTVLGTLRKLGRQELVPALWAGVVAAVVVSLGAAAINYVIGFQLSGPAEEIFEGITMLLAASVLTWMIFWMYHNARNLTATLESDV